jgi:hypothetical protein
LLAGAIDRAGKGRRVVLFFDELPWLASRKSGFLQALDHLWNAWGNRRRNLLLIVCGSAASWMIGKVVHNKGGLYNRLTAHIRLMPFSLAEVETYLGKRRINLGRKDILELYMCLGGIPHYLRVVQRGESVAQAVDRLCFARDGLLRDEIERLFASLFDRSERHTAVIRTLAKKRQGMTRAELLRSLGEPSGGGMTRVLDELEHSAFVSRERAFGRPARDSLYRLVDEYTLFHLNWVEPTSAQGRGFWLGRRNSRAWQAWAGFAFEGICLKHALQIKKALSIGGVSTVQSGWRTEVGGHRLQVDLVIDRADNCINLCEMKFSDRTFVIDKRYAEALRRTLRLFREGTRTRKNVFLTMLTTFGCAHNAYFDELVSGELTMDALFEE